MKKNKIIISLSALFLLISIFFVVSAINSSNENKKMVNAYDTKIDTIYSKFLTDKKDLEKTDSSTAKNITELNKEYEIYKNLNTKLNIDFKFTTKINDMKDYFIKKNDKVISENTLVALDKNKDKGKIMDFTMNLSNILATISNESNVIYTDEQYNKYKIMIDVLVKSYDERVRAIDKVMLDEKEAAAAAAKAKADEAKAKKAKEAAKAKEKAIEVAKVKEKEVANSYKSLNSNVNTNKYSNNSTNNNNNTKTNNYTPKNNVVVNNVKPATTSSSHGNIIRYAWSSDAAGNKLPGTTSTFYADGYVKGPDGRMYSPGEF